MGRIFYEHLGGKRIFSCETCETYLSNRHEVMSTNFRGATGRAFLFRRVVNIRESDVESREMMTGRHLVRDIFCKRCNTKLGWMYEFAVEPDQKYKEGRVILERKLVRESEEFDESLAERCVLGSSPVSSSGSSSGGTIVKVPFSFWNQEKTVRFALATLISFVSHISLTVIVSFMIVFVSPYAVEVSLMIFKYMCPIYD
ncbi:hypothetical protein AB6A40_001956 [Gnathostoma spinigerum]|uniref:Yippee domain-containing protein n=1 Tax=Gnathostoma spinigerum TaxID=75299 RepID=A0ABD6EFD9_9BILA